MATVTNADAILRHCSQPPLHPLGSCRVLPDTPPTRDEVQHMSVAQLKAFLQSKGEG